jgi:hypothetical protein
MKACTKCGESKPGAEFRESTKRGKKSVRPECRACERAYFRSPGYRVKANKKNALYRASELTKETDRRHFESVRRQLPHDDKIRIYDRGKDNPNFRHGMWGSSEYKTWKDMRRRCANSNHKDYPRYGGRGIKVCDRWRDSFANFYADMGARPAGTTLDRYPNGDGNYEPSNCRWATRLEQSQNRAATKITHMGARVVRRLSERRVPHREIAQIFGVTASSLWRHVRPPMAIRPESTE